MRWRVCFVINDTPHYSVAVSCCFPCFLTLKLPGAAAGVDGSLTVTVA